MIVVSKFAHLKSCVTNLVVVGLGQLGVLEEVVGAKLEVQLEAWLTLLEVRKSDVLEVFQGLSRLLAE